MNQLVVKPQEDLLVDLENTQRTCQQLMRTPHYQKIGEIGIFAIVQKAKSIGLSPLDALNGAMYFVNGKVELVANTMNYLIRAAGHSIIKDAKSNDKICILNGRRADNGDTWSATFSIDDAKRAGIYRGNWEKYPDDMLFARALSRLARQLFPDVIKGCYVEGEIAESMQSDRISNVPQAVTVDLVKPEVITKEVAADLYVLLKECPEEYQQDIRMFCKKNNISENLEGLPLHFLDRLTKAIRYKLEECKAALQQELEVQVEEAQ